MRTKKPSEAIREQAALYALGALPADEAEAVASALAAGDVALNDEVGAFASVVETLALAVPPQAPPPALRAAVLERIGAGAPAVIDAGGLRFVRSAATAWEPSPLAGIEVKRLFDDATAGRRTTLVRIAPGGSVPAHRHADVEEIYLLEGDLVLSGVPMRAGDYCRAEGGTMHDGIHSPGGCVLLMCASVRDEYYA